VSTASRLITYEESLLLPEDKLSEIVRGELRRTPPPRLSHALLIETLDLLLRRNLDLRVFAILVSSFGQLIRREPLTYRIPDLGVYQRNKFVDEHYISVIPELLVEVLSPANRKGNLGELIEDYQDLQAPEVWLVRPDERTVQRMLLEKGKLVDGGMYSSGAIAPRFSPDSTVDLDDLWTGAATRQ